VTAEKPSATRLNLADRKYLRFVIAAFVGLGLVVAGVFLYEPLRLTYAIYRAQHTKSCYRDKLTDRWVADVWLMRCVRAAGKGNRRAMEVLVERSGVITADWGNSVPRPQLYGGNYPYPDVAYVAGREQPALLLEVLEAREDEKVLEVLGEVVMCINGYGAVGLPCLAKAEYLDGNLKAGCDVADATDARLAREALVFVRRRFAKELNDAPKARREADRVVHRTKTAVGVDKRQQARNQAKAKLNRLRKEWAGHLVEYYFVHYLAELDKSEKTAVSTPKERTRR